MEHLDLDVDQLKEASDAISDKYKTPISCSLRENKAEFGLETLPEGGIKEVEDCFRELDLPFCRNIEVIIRQQDSETVTRFLY